MASQGKSIPFRGDVRHAEWFRRSGDGMGPPVSSVDTCSNCSREDVYSLMRHRSSVPLAKFFSTRGSSHHSSYQQPSFSTDLLSHLSRGSDRTPILLDPVTGDARVGSSSSGREAARVVKFSPPGAPRDLLVFSEVSLIISIRSRIDLPSHFPEELTSYRKVAIFT